MRKPYIIIIRELSRFVVSIFLLSVLVFTMSRLAPGDPLYSYYGERVEKMSTQEQEAARERLGLQEPIPGQYVRWLKSAIHGDFGISYKYKTDVKEVIVGRIGNTLLLGGLGFVIIFALALLLGLFCAWRKDKWADRVVCGIGTVTSCIPEFWLSLLLILVFAVCLGWLPSSGAYSVGMEKNLADRTRHLILPLTVVVLGHLWYYAYLVRNRLLEETRADYVLLARMKGLSGKQVLYRHCLRNALPSYLSMMAIALPHILGGTYVAETVFSYPGIGTLAYESARYQDYNLLMLISLMTGALVILGNMFAKIVNERIDPRMRMKTGGPAEEVRGF
ncbi:MAG: ABC transporter permease [Lachnospiraceae bacterium]|nr:ABC transporter permease [Lachnospiraceae bacterium]